jgi:hypothetical protein
MNYLIKILIFVTIIIEVQLACFAIQFNDSSKCFEINNNEKRVLHIISDCSYATFPYKEIKVPIEGRGYRIIIEKKKDSKLFLDFKELMPVLNNINAHFDLSLNISGFRNPEFTALSKGFNQDSILSREDQGKRTLNGYPIYLALNLKDTTLPDNISNLRGISTLKLIDFIDTSILFNTCLLAGCYEIEFISNKLKYISNNILNCCNHYKRIIFNSTPNLDLDSLFKSFADLKDCELIIKNFDVKKLPESINNFKSCLRLTFDSLNLYELPKNIKDLRNLKSISLNGNNIKRFPIELTNLPNLIVASLGNNEIDEIPSEIGNMESLEFLFLENNNISNLPSEILNLKKLKVLWLNNNKIDEKTKNEIKSMFKGRQISIVF